MSKQFGSDSPLLDVIGTSRTYYDKARWTKPPDFCTCPCEPKCHQSQKEYTFFSDKAWSSDDEDYSETYYNLKNEVMCVRHEQTGKILTTGDTRVPGVGAVKLKKDLQTAAQTGRIFTNQTNPEKLSADSFLTPKKFIHYLHGQPLLSNPGKALHQKPVPTVLFVYPTSPLKEKNQA
jgi:hypothetical protein